MNNFIKVTGQYLRDGGVKADLLDSRAQACVEKLQGKVTVSPVRCLTDEKVPLSDPFFLLQRGLMTQFLSLKKQKQQYKTKAKPTTKQKQALLSLCKENSSDPWE